MVKFTTYRERFLLDTLEILNRIVQAWYLRLTDPEAGGF